ncbi:stomatal closure-related actin-binding protein 1-like [Zingiber officinale]|uniref:stomatal closure-related actin-binding protein 1-like n=1 Tax=Zingiber officinale TaxID=94328 RepID=UPI001C4C9C21|nr:stomatal closure-related actin-binding protein 1-like [Zingiber officinale]XP_042433605.1 stomatal closure-related actin-binding protein 1-like [Zingiber officinale]
MTRVAGEFGDPKQKEAMKMVSSDVNFVFSQAYDIGDNSITLEQESTEMPSLKEIVAKETSELLEQKKRLSVRDLTKRFEQGLSEASKLSNEAKWREVASLDRHVLLKKLRDVLDSLRGRVAGRNKDDADEAISMVEVLAVQLTQREGELIQEKAELKRLATFLRQTTEDAKRAVEEERALAHAEIENALDAVQRVEKAFQDQKLITSSSNKHLHELEELRKEVQEARRIKMLHQPSRVMDMEHELQALRAQLTEKSMNCIQLKRELAKVKRVEENISDTYQLEGSESLGSCLCIVPQVDSAPSISNYHIQWYRMLPGGNKELIFGATKPVYAPEPYDVGRLLQAEIILDDQKMTVTTTGPIDPAAGLGDHVENLLRKPDTEFNVVIMQMNGRDYHTKSAHVFLVGKMKIKLRKGKSTMAKESYSSSMLLCGVRGGGNAAARSLLWQVRKGLTFTLAFEFERERNAAIMLARRFAFDCNIVLAGPDDRSSRGT